METKQEYKNAKTHYSSEQFIKQFQSELLLKNKMQVSYNAAKNIAQTYANTIRFFLAETKPLAKPEKDKIPNPASKRGASEIVATIALTDIGNLSVVDIPPRNYYDIDSGEMRTSDTKRIIKLTTNSKINKLL